MKVFNLKKRLFPFFLKHFFIKIGRFKKIKIKIKRKRKSINANTFLETFFRFHPKTETETEKCSAQTPQ